MPIWKKINMVWGETRNQGDYTVLKLIRKNMYKINKPMYIVFYFLEQAFNNANRNKSFSIIKSVKIDFKDGKIIRKLYLKAKAVIIRKTLKNQIL